MSLMATETVVIYIILYFSTGVKISFVFGFSEIVVFFPSTTIRINEGLKII